MPLLQEQRGSGSTMRSMPSPRPDEGFFHAPLRELPQSAHAPRLESAAPSPHSNKAFRPQDIPTRKSSISQESHGKSPARHHWASRSRSDRQPDRPWQANDENIHFRAAFVSPSRRDSEATVRSGYIPSPVWSSVGLMSAQALPMMNSVPCSDPILGTTASQGRPFPSPSLNVNMLRSPVQQRSPGKRTFIQSQTREPSRPGTPPTWVTHDPFASFRNPSLASSPADRDVTAGAVMDTVGALQSGPIHNIWANGMPGHSSATHSLAGDMAFFSHHSNLIQPIPTMAVAASLSHSTAPRQHVSSPAAQPSQQQLQKHFQQLGQPFLPSFDEPQAVSRPSKSKKNRRSAEVYSSIPKGTTSVAEKSPSSRMRMPSHTSLLLGLSLGPAFGDDENSAPVSGPLLLQHQLAEAQVPSQGGSKREQHGKRGSRGGSIARGKVTKAARLPLGGSPSFGLNILGLGDALDDAAFVYLEKDAQCQSPVPNIVITPPAVIVAHTPSRLARSESKAGTLLLLSMSDLGTAAADAGSKLAPAAISTDSPSVRSISSNLTMTSASATVNGGELLMGQVAAYDEPTVVSPPRSMSPPATARAGCAPGEWSQQHNFYSPPEVEVDPKVLSVIQQRMGEDQACFTELALEIDVILSEYIYINSPTQAWIVGRRLTTVLLNAIYGQGFAKVPPTLRKLRQVGEGMLPDDWVETESERLLEKVLDHVVTGILVVLADPRSPFETPQSLAQLCCSLKISLSSHNGSPHNTEVEIPCLSPYGGMASGQPSPPVNAPSQAPSRDLGLLFEEIVFANLRDILKKGEDVRDRACRLEVPLARKGNKKRWEMASLERVRAAADQQKIRKLAVKGLISGDEFVKLERRRAAKGNVRDQFADISVLRFVGELYRVSFIGLPDVQSWLERMLFDTVYPGVPSLYELGCACALITIIGPQLEAIADKEDRQAYVLSARHVSRILQPPSRPIPETPIRSKEQQMSRNWRRPLRPDAPANHWIQCSPAAAIRSPTSPFSSASVSTRTVSCGSGKLSLSSFGSMHSVQSSCSSNWSGSTPALSPPPTAKNEGNETRLTVTGCMDRLGELLKQDDAEEGVKEIIKSVLGLYFRGWVTSSIPFTPTRHAL